MTKDEAVQKVIDLAKSQLGYLEKRNSDSRYLDDFTANAGSGNCTKYHRDLDNPQYFNTKKMGAEWCAIFVHWCFTKSFGMANSQKMLYCGAKSSAAGCWLGARYFRNNNAFYTTPQLGDQIFFGTRGDEEHTGIVVGITASTVTTIEGNSHDGVRQHQYSRKSSYISGYGRPNWSVVANGKPEVTYSTIKIQTCKKGSTGETVKTLQQLLISKWNISCGKTGADGVFGADTETAVKNFQRKMSYRTIDGIVGKVTWTDLITK